MDSKLVKIRKYIEKDILKVNNLLLSIIKSDHKLEEKVAKNILSSGGKRIRPVLTIISGKLSGVLKGSLEYDNLIKLAVAVELIHNATLLHDDVIDSGVVRRGSATANNVWGNKASILVGDFLLAQSFLLMTTTGNLEALSNLSNSSVVIIKGEIRQLENVGKLQDIQSYLQTIEAKTAQLFASATEIGGIIANIDSTKKQALRSFGYNLGMAFQIIDDVLDYIGGAEELGKEVGNDYREGKITIPVIHAYSLANKDEKVFLSNCFKEKDNAKLSTVAEILSKYNAFNSSIDLANDYTNKAIGSLNSFENCLEKELLLDIASFIIERKF